MAELGSVGKIMKALKLSKEAQVGITLDYFQCLELLGYIKSLEEEIRLLMHDPFVGDSDHEHDDRIL